MKNAHLFIIFLFLAILPFCYLSFFTNPSSDDFGFACQAQNNGLWDLTKQTFLNWNGRYISNFFIYLNPIANGNFMGYKMIPVVFIILFLVACYYFISKWFHFLNRTLRVMIALIFSLLFINNMPIISEGLYWYTGSVIYFLGLILSLIYLGLLIHQLKTNKIGMTTLLLTGILFLICGFNEVLSLLFLIGLSLATWLVFKKRLQAKKVLSIQLVMVIIFSGVMFFSPGNEYRSAAYDNTHDIMHSLSYSCAQVIRFFSLWTLSLPLIAASVLYFQLNKKLVASSRLFQQSFYVNRWVSLLLMFITIFICVFPAYWATGILGQHRTLNVAYFFFIICWFMNLTVWFNYYNNKVALQSKKRVLVASFLIIGLIGTNNGYKGLKDIFTGSAKNYNDEMNERYLTLSTPKKLPQTIFLKPIQSKPKTLFVSDISNSPDDWVNQAYIAYFGLGEKEVVLDKK